MTFQNLERRYKIVYIPENALINCLTLSASSPGDCLVKYSLDGVPPGTLVLYRGYSPVRGVEAVTLWNKEWPIVPEYEEIPEIKVEARPVMVKGTEPRRESACDQPLIRNAGTFTLEVKNGDGVTVRTAVFENPISVGPGETLILSGYMNSLSEPIGEAKLTGTGSSTRALEGEVELDLSPFDKTWRDKEPLC